jgi:AcrR family transcriptional regulator
MAKAAEDKPYHHGDLRQSLIDAACKHLQESGADTLSLRALARELGVSQTAPYRHFESKSALFRAIAVYGFEMLRDETAAVAAKYPDDPETAIVEIGVAYLDFAMRNPEKYQLFFDSSLVDFRQSEDLVSTGTSAFEVLTKVIQQGIDEGVFVDRPVTEPAGTIWASIHGATSLLLSKEPALRESGIDGPVTQAMSYMAAEPRKMLEMFVQAIRRPC